MTFYRITDIKTPPFAYVVNRDLAIRACPLCMMPFDGLNERLKVEIFTTEVAAWESTIGGQLLMAEHWLIGDDSCMARLTEVLGSSFDMEPVDVVSWLSRSPTALQSARAARVREGARVPQFFRILPRSQLAIESELVERFPPIRCQACQRDIPDIPFDVPLIPEPSQDAVFASLQDIHFEGYDFLISETVIEAMRNAFPRVLLEPLETGEPSLF